MPRYALAALPAVHPPARRTQDGLGENSRDATEEEAGDAGDDTLLRFSTSGRDHGAADLLQTGSGGGPWGSDAFPPSV